MQSPATVGSGSAAYRPEMLLWTEVPSGLVLAVEMAEPKDGVPSSGKVLQRLLSRRPHPEAAARPERIRVESETLARELREVTDIPVVVGPTPEMAEIVESLVEHFNQLDTVDDSDYLQDGEIAEPIMRELFCAAATLWCEAPWTYLWDGDVIRVDAPALGVRGAALSVIGGNEECYGLVLFPSFDAFERFVQAAEAMETRGPAARPDFGSTWLSLDYNDADRVPAGMCEEVKRYGWPLPAPDVYPMVNRHDHHGVFLPPGETEVRIMAAVTGALVPFLRENHPVFDEDSDKAVTMSFTDGAGVDIEFAYPYEAGDALPRRDDVPSSTPAFKLRAARNAPCPCGSGEKYKKCCLAADEAKASTGNPAQLHEIDARLVAQIRRFITTQFGGIRVEDLAAGAFMNATYAQQLAVPWVLYGRRVGKNTFAELFVRQQGARLSSEERAWIEAQSRAHLSLWEVTSVAPGHGLDTRDLLTAETRSIREVMGSRTLRARDTILARIVTVGELSVLAGSHPRVLSPMAAAGVLDAVRTRLRKKTGTVPAERLRDDRVARTMIQAWERAVQSQDERAARPPILQNTDGEPLLWTTDRFDIEPGAREKVAALVAGMDDVEAEEEGTFTVVRPSKGKKAMLENTVLGRIELRKLELKVETNSVERADTLRALLERLCGGLIRFRARTDADPTSEAHARVPAPLADEAPPPDLQAALREVQERHLAAWPDQPIPALGGKTPRQAMKTKSGRQAVDLLIRDWEHHMSRMPAGMGRMDLSRVRSELGLDPLTSQKALDHR